jgi:glycosyltransferase involved in cell wall biosynthesis
MKIIHLRASNFYGGPERQLHLHALYAKKESLDVAVCSFSERGVSPEFLEIIARDGVKTHAFQVKSAYDRRAIKLVRKYIIDNNIDIVCSHDYRSHMIAFCAVKETTAGWVAFSRGWTKDNLKVRAYQLLDKFIIRFAHHIAAVSHEQKRKLERLGVSEWKITVAHNAVEADRFGEIPAVDLIGRFNFPSGSIIGVAAGRFSREKGQKVLVKAARAALERDNRLRFILFGDGPDFAKIKNMVERMNLEGRILCPGFEKNLLGCLKGADFLINPSFSEGLPNIVLEAMALGIPVVATAVGGTPELIANEKSGLLVPSGDAEALSAAILRIAKDMSLREKLSRAGYEKIQKDFAFEKQTQILKKVYENVVNMR